jgi:hypothetical protein
MESGPARPEHQPSAATPGAPNLENWYTAPGLRAPQQPTAAPSVEPSGARVPASGAGALTVNEAVITPSPGMPHSEAGLRSERLCLGLAGTPDKRLVVTPNGSGFCCVRAGRFVGRQAKR